MATLTINPDGTAWIEVENLTGDEGTTYIENATVTARLQSLPTTEGADGTDLTGQTWPLTLSNVAGSTTGRYRGRVENDVVYPVIGKSVQLKVSVTSGSDTRITRDVVKVMKATGAA